MDAAFFRDWMAAAAAVVETQRDHLTQLDAAIGDADHGINMARGFGAITTALEQKDTPTPGSVLTLAGSTLISKVGGASGPLYGMALRSAGKALGDTPDADLHALAGALEAALTGVQKLGAAREGDGGRAGPGGQRARQGPRGGGTGQRRPLRARRRGAGRRPGHHLDAGAERPGQLPRPAQRRARGPRRGVDGADPRRPAR